MDAKNYCLIPPTMSMSMTMSVFEGCSCSYYRAWMHLKIVLVNKRSTVFYHRSTNFSWVNVYASHDPNPTIVSTTKRSSNWTEPLTRSIFHTYTIKFSFSVLFSSHHNFYSFIIILNTISISLTWSFPVVHA